MWIVKFIMKLNEIRKTTMIYFIQKERKKINTILTNRPEYELCYLFFLQFFKTLGNINEENFFVTVQSETSHRITRI